jgi:RimJ/RimL family protein N-acetyltransferase
MDSLVKLVRAKPRKHSVAAALPALVSVYRLPKAAPPILYQLLQERDARVNISHRTMPTWKEHLRFIARHPYDVWYMIRSEQEYVGAIYLTAMNEIGIGILARWRGRGYGPAAIKVLMRKHPRERFLANINPNNVKSIGMFTDMGFHIIQKTFELRTR